MKKFLEYVYMRDYNDEYLFPSPIGHIVFVILTFICIAICNHKGKEDEVKHIDMSIAIDTTAYPAEQVVIEEDKVNVNEDFVIPKSKHWSSQETKLPIGIVYRMDFAGSGTKKQTQSDNYITVKTTSGSLVITRDIDVDLYLNIDVGDTIR